MRYQTPCQGVENKLPVSVCMIAGPEGHRISKSLDSISSWAGEIIIVLNEDVDDETEQIANIAGAAVFREKWKGHIAQKNSAAIKANFPWTLGLDADEIVSTKMQKEIRVITQSPHQSSSDYYSFPRCTEYEGKMIRHGDWYPDRQTRLWKTGSAQWGGVNPHDKLLTAKKPEKLSGEIIHYSMTSLDHQIKKYLCYADVFASECQNQNRRVSRLDLFFRPTWRFIRGYFLKLGFLDGWQGLAIARMTAFYTFLRYFKALEIQTHNRN